MVQKPKIQYVGQFYVHGSEARALEAQEKKQAKTSLPIAKLEAIETIFIDPVALIGIAVAVVMLAVMVFGAIQLKEDWESYARMADYVTDLKTENARLSHTYQTSYDLADIEMKALAMGMVPQAEVEVRTVTVTMPVREPELTWDQKVVRSWNELWEGVE